MLRGTVRDPAGTPVTGINVWARTPGGSWRLESVGAKKWGDNSVDNYGAYIDFLVKNGVLKPMSSFMLY